MQQKHSNSSMIEHVPLSSDNGSKLDTDAIVGTIEFEYNRSGLVSSISSLGRFGRVKNDFVSSSNHTSTGPALTNDFTLLDGAL